MEEHYKKVTFKEARQILDTRPDCIMFDVREEVEYNTGHAQEAELFTLADIDEDTAAERIPSYDTPILVYCRSGHRSFEAAQKLIEYGYREIYDIGSLIGWPYGMF